jgi:hypothetical protein
MGGWPRVPLVLEVTALVRDVAALVQAVLQLFAMSWVMLNGNGCA